MWLTALYIWGTLLAFSACDSCPDPEDAASWVKLELVGNCEDEENFCPYQITLPPFSIQLPRLEKMARELQNLKELVNQLRRDCQECKERQWVERGGWKDHDEEEEEAQTLRHINISSTERQSLNGEQVVRVITSTLPQGNTAEMEGIIRSGVKRINPSSLERHEYNSDRNDADQGTLDQISEMSREVKVFDLPLEETSGDTSEVKQVFLPITEDIQSDRKFQPDELLEPSIPRTKDFVQSVTHGSEVSREVKIFDPSLEETPGDISEVKQVFSSPTKVIHSEQTFQQGELLESPIPRTKDFVQSITHGNQQPNIFRDRNVKNITGILAMRRRVQNMTNANGLGSISGNANTKTVSAGNRQLVNFSRTGGPLRPKTYINNRAVKVSDEDRLRNPAVVRTHPQARDKTVRAGPTRNGFSLVRRPGTKSGQTLSTREEKMTVINSNSGNNSGLTSSTEEERMTVINPNPGTNSGLTSSTEEEKMTIINPNLGTNSGLTLSTDGEELTIDPRPGTKIGLTSSTEDKKRALINTKPRTNSGLTLSEEDQKITNKEDISTDSDPRTDYENDLKDARQVSPDGEENFRKLNTETKITTTQTNLRKEDQGDVSHTAQITNKSFSMMSRAEQPNLIRVENEHMGTDASLVMSSTDADKADSSSPGRQVEKETYLTPNKGTQTLDGHEDLSSTVLDITNEKQTNPLPPDQDHTQSGAFTEAVNEEMNYNSLSAETVKKTILSDSKASQLETDLVNPTHIPSVRERTVSIASKVESPVVNQGTRRILISQPIKPKSGEDVVNIQSMNSNKNISRIREASNIRFQKNLTRVMPKFPIRPGRYPTTVISSGAPKPNTINKISGNSSVVVPSNFPISLRNSSFGRRNGTVMTKPSYVRRRPNLQSEPNASIPNRGFKTNVSPVTQFISSTGKTSDRTEENKDIPQAMTNLTSTELKSLPEITRNAGNTLDLDTVRHGKDHSSVTVLTSKVVDDKEDSNKDNSLHSGASDSLGGVEETKQFSFLTTVTNNEHPMGVEKVSSMNLSKPQNSRPTASTQNKELSGVNKKPSFILTGHGETTKHVEIVQDISQVTISPPISFENTVATREVELIKLNEERMQKYSREVLSNPNTVDDVQGNNGGRYKVPVVLDMLTNVEEIKGSEVFTLSPEDTADGFKTIAVGDEVTQKDRAENKIHSTCVSDCINTPTQQPATQSRPLFNERGRGLPQDCADYMTKTHNGVYRVTPRSKNNTFQVFCDMETTSGGWTLIQQRFDGSTSFNHTWDEYKKGFGKLTGEFWLGNDKIHWLTQAKNMSLRIELEDFEGVREFAHYDRFHVANESQQYRLSIGGYSGTAGNAMQFNKMYNHDQKLFTTPDRDNDLYPSGNCGVYYSSGWWFDACMSANLNGKYYHTKYKGVRNGIFWGTWHNITMEYYPTNERQSFKTVRMMIRPRKYAN